MDTLVLRIIVSCLKTKEILKSRACKYLCKYAKRICKSNDETSSLRGFLLNETLYYFVLGAATGRPSDLTSFNYIYSAGHRLSHINTVATNWFYTTYEMHQVLRERKTARQTHAYKACELLRWVSGSGMLVESKDFK